MDVYLGIGGSVRFGRVAGWAMVRGMEGVRWEDGMWL